MSIEFETIAEKTSFSGSPQTSWRPGETAYTKWFDNTSGKWERWSGSGAPQVSLSGDVRVTKTFSASVTGGQTGSLWTPASGKSIRLKMYSLSTDTCGRVALMAGSGSTIDYIKEFFMNATGSVAMNLVGCNWTGSKDYKLFVSGSATSVILASAWGDEF